VPCRLTTTLGEEPSDKLTVLDLPIAIGIRLNMKSSKHLIFNPSLETKMNYMTGNFKTRIILQTRFGFFVGRRGFNKSHHPHILQKNTSFLRVGTMFSSSCFGRAPTKHCHIDNNFATHPFTSTYSIL